MDQYVYKNKHGRYAKMGKSSSWLERYTVEWTANLNEATLLPAKAGHTMIELRGCQRLKATEQRRVIIHGWEKSEG